MKKDHEKMNREPAPSVRIIPLGGLEQIGMNITAFEFGDSIVVVDCGLAFPEDDMFGIDLVIPDTTYLEENIDKVKGFVITHGHEDHIGALPYVLKKINGAYAFAVFSENSGDVFLARDRLGIKPIFYQNF